MTTKTEALKLALEALKESQTDNDTMEFWERKTIAIFKCQELLAQPEQEPVAWMHEAEGRVDVIHSAVKALWIKVGQPSGFYREKVPCKVEHYTIPLYTSPRMREHITDGTVCWCTPIVESALKEKREWVGLTSEQIREIHSASIGKDVGFATGLTEAKLKELNHDNA